MTNKEMTPEEIEADIEKYWEELLNDEEVRAKWEEEIDFAYKESIYGHYDELVRQMIEDDEEHESLLSK